MSTEPHADDAPGHGAVADAPDAHGQAADVHGHDGHGEADPPLGPIDPLAWGAGLLGVLIGVGIAAAFAWSTGAWGLR